MAAVGGGDLRGVLMKPNERVLLAKGFSRERTERGDKRTVMQARPMVWMKREVEWEGEERRCWGGLERGLCVGGLGRIGF